MNRRHWEQQLQDAFDGVLSDADAEALAERLRSSPAALADYCDQAIMEAELRRETAGARWIPGATPASSRFAVHVHRRRAVISLAVAASVMLLGGLVLRMFWAPAIPAVQVSLTPGSILLAANGSPVVGNELAAGESWMLGQGVAEIRFPNRVRALIDGPASLRIVAENCVEIAGGHSWFHVPPSAAGFRVVTPGFEVTDLGTAFGIDLREDLPPQVHCLEGLVEIRARIGNRHARLLAAGQAAVLRPNGRWTGRSADLSKFRTTLPAEIPSLTLGLTEFHGHVIPVTGDLPGIDGAGARLIHSENARIVIDEGGPALELDGAYIESDWPGISGSAPRTFATWCRLPSGYRPPTAPPLALWGNPATGWNRKFKIAVAANNERTHLRVSFGEIIINGTSDLADGRWHHLAVTYQGNDPAGRPLVRMFVDGVEEVTAAGSVSSGEIRTETETTRSVGLSLGRYELPTHNRDPFLRAALRDYRIFAGVLGPDEIRSLARPAG